VSGRNGDTFYFEIDGRPIPQGSKINYGVGKLVDQNHKKLKPWREKIAQEIAPWAEELKEFDYYKFDYLFLFHAPKVREKQANKCYEKTKGFLPMFVKPDGDKLIRAVNDAFTQGTGIDDSKIRMGAWDKMEMPSHVAPEGLMLHITGYKLEKY